MSVQAQPDSTLQEAMRLHAQARELLWSGRVPEALIAYEQAFQRDPAGVLDRRECMDRFRYLQFDTLPAFWHAEVERFFGRDDIDKSRYLMTGLRVLMTKPAFRAVRTAEARTKGLFAPDAAALDDVMRDELFGLLLRDTLFAQPEFEMLLTRLRAALLLDPVLRSRAPLDFLCNLALQCFNNEFVFAQSREEDTAVVKLQSELDVQSADALSNDENRLRLVATTAMYRPLHSMSGIEVMLGQPGLPEAFRTLLDRTVGNVLEERRLSLAVRVMGPITNAVSLAVRAQYEVNPYPRWLSFDRPAPVAAADWLAGEVPMMAAPAQLASAPRILIAGCGTGVETLALAIRIPDAQITAIDLSAASLAYAQRKARELAITNVEFRQADILELGDLSERFDIIYSVGVLVTMRDPAAGLRVLARLLPPGGLLKLGLYSEQARADVNVAREIIRQRSLSATDAVMRAFRQELFAAPPDSPLKKLLRWRDLYTLSECRDLLFHVEEHQFSLPQVGAMLRECGLEILGLSKQMPPAVLRAYREMFPHDQRMNDLGNWDLFETHFPDTFIGMYQIWSRAPETGVAR